MITFFKTENGIMRKVDAPSPGCWINVISPDKDEIKVLTNEFNVNPEYIRYALDEEESSRIENEDGQTLITVDVPLTEKNDDNSVIYSTIPLGIVVMRNYVVTICTKDNATIHEFADEMVKNVDTSLKTRFVLQLFLRMSARYLQYLKQIDRYSGFVERKLRKTMKNRELIQMLDLEKSLVYFRTSLKSDAATIEKMARGRYLKLYEEDKELLDDVMVEIKQAIEMANIYSSVLSETMEALSSIISNNLNSVMKVLTSITVLMAIPTMIFSFYGMNIGETAGGLILASNTWIPLGIALVATLLVGIWLWKKDMF